MLKNFHLVSCFIISVLAITNSYAQKESRLTGNSPYSALGIGDILSSGSIANDAMAGSGLTFSNGIYVNTINPAMLAKSRFVSFNTGLRGQYKKITDGTNSQKDFGMNLSHINMSFPIKTKWTMAVGLQPYSSVEHEARFKETIVGTDKTVEYIYKGQGGISKATFGNGYQIGKSLFVGAELGYYFGSVKRDTTSKLILNDGEDYYLRYSDLTSNKGLGFKTGVVYQQKLSDKWVVNFGGTYEFKTKLNSDRIRSLSTLLEGQNGPEVIKKPDTLGISSGSLSLPAKYAIGISLESPYKWVFSAEYSKQDWAKYLNFNGKQESNLSSSERIAFGVEYLPNFSSTKYLNQVFYRMGFQHLKTPYFVNGTHISDNSFSFGLSTPLAYRNISYIDFAFAAGQRGVVGNGLVKESYFKVSLGFSLVDTRWFIKPKID